MKGLVWTNYLREALSDSVFFRRRTWVELLFIVFSYCRRRKSYGGYQRVFALYTVVAVNYCERWKSYGGARVNLLLVEFTTASVISRTVV